MAAPLRFDSYIPHTLVEQPVRTLLAERADAEGRQVSAVIREAVYELLGVDYDRHGALLGDDGKPLFVADA